MEGKKINSSKVPPSYWRGHANTHTPTGVNKTERKKGKKSENSLYCINSVHSLDLTQAVTVEVNSLPKDALDLAYTELTSA